MKALRGVQISNEHKHSAAKRTKKWNAEILTYIRRLFKHREGFSESISNTVQIQDGRLIDILGVGKIKFSMKNNIVILCDVLHVRGIFSLIFSMQAHNSIPSCSIDIDDFGFTIMFLKFLIVECEPIVHCSFVPDVISSLDKEFDHCSIESFDTKKNRCR